MSRGGPASGQNTVHIYIHIAKKARFRPPNWQTPLYEEKIWPWCTANGQRIIWLTVFFTRVQSPPLWGQAAAWAPVTQRARVRSPVGTGFLGEVFSGLFFTCKTNVRKLLAPRSPNIIWPSLSSSLSIHYGRQWPEMLTRPKNLNIHTYTYEGTIDHARYIREILAPFCDELTYAERLSVYFR